MDTEAYMQAMIERGHGDGCKLHECCEWDGLPICTHSLEFQYCNCFDEVEK